MKQNAFVTNLWWKLGGAFTLCLAIFAIYDNSQSVRKLELQVCATVHESNERLGTIQYYEDHPDEAKEVRRQNMVVLNRFNCPPPKVVAEEQGQ